MTATVLVTGSPQRVEPVSAALRAAGAQVHSVSDLDRIEEEITQLAAGTVDCYVQLPVTLQPSGDAVVGRVRDFLDKGLLTRFRWAEAVLPALSQDGKVVLVAGNTLPEANAPDDQGARVALLDVLAHAIRADKAPAKVRVRIVPDAADPEEIARAALTSDATRSRTTEPRGRSTRADDMSYEDWRTEVLGMASIDF